MGSLLGFGNGRDHFSLNNFEQIAIGNPALVLGRIRHLNRRVIHDVIAGFFFHRHF